jgi:formate hydrogenlyase subunit 3/multisubunit Na+/H+ antiporter MnhD subunit
MVFCFFENYQKPIVRGIAVLQKKNIIYSFYFSCTKNISNKLIFLKLMDVFMHLFYFSIVAILCGGFFSLFFKDDKKEYPLIFFSLLATISLVFLSGYVLLTGTTVSWQIILTYPLGLIKLIVDPLSAFFILLISVLSFIGILYSVQYLKNYYNKGLDISSHFMFLCIFICAMLILVTLQNTMAFLIIWELMSVSSFFLIMFENHKKDVFEAGLLYFVMMHISLIFILFGFVLIGGYSWAFLADIALNNKFLADMIFFLLFIGFGFKAGFMPLHTWLPKAHPAAPSHVSGLMSGLMIKLGIYGILRTIMYMGAPSLWLIYLIFIISLVTVCVGILYSLAQKDIKKLLAYSSIENIGLIGTGIAVGLLGINYHYPMLSFLGFGGALLHILNHAVFKQLLFYLAGIIYSKTHTLNMEEMGGLLKTMPQTGFNFLLGNLAICGLPPLNGFISKFVIYLAVIYALTINNPLNFIIASLAIIILALASGMTILGFSKFFSVVFLGSARSEKIAAIKNDVSFSFLLPTYILAFACILIGLFPKYVFNFIYYPIINFNSNQNIDIISPIFALFSKMFWLFILLVVFLVLIKHIWQIKKTITTTVTWACGYMRISPKMQYTGASYVQPLESITEPFLRQKISQKRPIGVFPKSADFSAYTEDLINFVFIRPLGRSINAFFNFFNWIQSGNLQHYILYGLLTLAAGLIYIWSLYL